MRHVEYLDQMGFELYTEAEKEAYRENLETVSKTELESRIQEQLIEYLESDEYKELAESLCEVIVDKYPKVIFDFDLMFEKAETIETVYNKFERFRSMNENYESEFISSYTLKAKGRNEYISMLLTAYYKYVQMISSTQRANEMELIKQLPSILNKEYGNFTGIQDIPKFFIEGVGKGVGSIIKIGTDVITDITKEAFKEILGTDWKKKLILYGSIIGVSIIGILILVFVVKTKIVKEVMK